MLSHQAEALTSEKKFTALASGLGSGKTWTGVHWVIKQSQESPSSKGFIGATTFSQLQNSTLAAVFSELQRIGIPYNYNKSSGILELLGKRWLCKSMDNYDVLRGMEVGEIWLDECAYMKEDAFKVIVGRLRDKRGKLKMLLTSTPKGYNWFYHYMHPDGDNYKSELVKIIRGASDKNTFLPEGYIETLRAQYDERLLEQELGGEFVNIASGVIYYAFNRELHTRQVKVQSYNPIWVGMDFNPNRMAAVVGQVINNRLHILDEIFDTTPGANTDKVCKELISRYGKNLTVVPDSTGKKATSNASQSDLQIIQANGLQLKVIQNPFRVDRYAAVNSAFSKGLIEIDESCINLIKDLESVTYKEGTDKVDTTDPNHGHMTDAFGYLLYRTVNPLIRPFKLPKDFSFNQRRGR